MDGAVCPMVCILSHDDNDITLLGLDNGGGVDHLETRDFMVVNTGNVDTAVVLVDDAESFATKNATISSPIDEGTALRARDDMF